MASSRSLFPVLCAMMAIVCSLLGSFWCIMVQYDAIVINGQAAAPTLKFGPWLRQKTSFVTETANDKTTLYAYQTCVPYDTDVTIDSKWKAARAFSIITPVMGVVLVGVTCINPDPNISRFVGMMILVLLTLFQGLTFLIFQSSLCQSIPGTNGPNGYLLYKWYPNGCGFSVGSVATIISVVFWLITGASLIAMGAVA